MKFRTAALALALVVFPAFAEEAPSPKEEKVRHLMKLTNAGAMGVQMVDNILATLKQSTAGQDEFWAKFREKVDGNELVNLLVPVYVRNLSDAELDAAIAFFGSPAGQGFVQKQPQIMQESMAIGEKWGAEIATRALEEMQSTREE